VAELTTAKDLATTRFFMNVPSALITRVAVLLTSEALAPNEWVFKARALQQPATASAP
jgi:hypothetical protein